MADILFDIGLCHHSVEERPKRKAIDKPIVMSVVIWVYMIERIASIMISDDYNLALMCLGDVGRSAAAIFLAKIRKLTLI